MSKNWIEKIDRKGNVIVVNPNTVFYIKIPNKKTDQFLGFLKQTKNTVVTT